MYRKPGEPLFYLPWQRGYRNPTGNPAIDIKPVGGYTPNEDDPLWEKPPDLDNPDEGPDGIDDEVAEYVPYIDSKPQKRILVRPVVKEKPVPVKRLRKGGIVL